MAAPVYTRFRPAAEFVRYRRQASIAGMSKSCSSLYCDAWVIIHSPQGDATAARARFFSGAEMFGEDFPHRFALLLVDRSPSRHLVVPAGLQPAAVVEFQVRNELAG